MSAIPHSTDEARELLQNLQERVSDFDARLNALSSWLDNTQDRVAELEDENEALKERLESLESRLDILEEGATTKEGKVRLLVEKAENLCDAKQVAVCLSARDIVGATGVSRRYAYDLIDDLPEEFHWILTRQEARQQQYGSLELDADAQERGVVIDCEALHSDPEAVNKFTTGTRSEGGQ